MVMQYETALGRNWTPIQNRRFGHGRIADFQVELLKQPTKAQIHRAIYDDTECALAVMFTDQGDGRTEVRIWHPRHGDQQLVTECRFNLHNHSIDSGEQRHNKTLVVKSKRGYSRVRGQLKEGASRRFEMASLVDASGRMHIGVVEAPFVQKVELGVIEPNRFRERIERRCSSQNIQRRLIDQSGA